MNQRARILLHLRLLACIALSLGISCLAAAEGETAEGFDYIKDIRPIFTDNCFQCHGPDEAARKANLRLDLETGFRGKEDGGRGVVVPGDATKSELFARISTANPDERMPPPATKLTLTSDQKDMIRRWIDAGASWEGHWAFTPPVKPPVPELTEATWCNNAIDYFVLKKLEEAGLSPSEEAPRETLLRRVSLDLSGLPPTPDEVAAFVADTAENAYEKVVDRLLASPQYGERMAFIWLDIARYADTHGYQRDSKRYMWVWRDWVIDAFNNNMPFDEFTIDQMAGDLLPNPALEQRIATGFNRNHRINGEGGIIPEEYAVEYVVDRVATTSTAWMGLTMGCARCHDHKFDPISQTEFYEMYAFFDQVPEQGKGSERGNDPPLLKVPTPEQQARLDTLQATIDKLEEGLYGAGGKPGKSKNAAQKAILAKFAAAPWNTVVPSERSASGKTELELLDDGSLLASGDNPDKQTYEIRFPATGPIRMLRLEVLRDDSLPEGGPGRAENGNVVLTGFEVARTPADSSDMTENTEVVAAVADYEQSGGDYAVSNAIDGSDKSGWATGSHQVREDRVAYFALGEDNGIDTGDAVTVRLKHRSQHAVHSLGRFRLSWTESADVADWAGKSERLAIEKKALADLEADVTSVMVMEDMEQRRDTYLLKRGDYTAPDTSRKLFPSVPAVLGEMDESLPRNRLGLAQWLMDPKHPLTARVRVNHYWQMYFARGLVKTSEDFGTQGSPPTHPELLDWLAVDFIESGWDVKRMQKQIVMSATYRQSSKATEELLARDPENLLLVHAPRPRLSAERLRDQALQVSGLLNPEIGGPPVYPYQPPNMWSALTFQNQDAYSTNYYTPDTGEKVYRRGLYTYWKRTISPPRMQIFDASSREQCSMRQDTTNTPMQAMVLLNDPTFVEAARHLGERMYREGGTTPLERVRRGYELVLAYTPDPAREKVLIEGLKYYLGHFSLYPDEARALLEVGDSEAPGDIGAPELAAYTMVASVMLNLDETITRE